MTDPYTLLGVSRSADDDEIKAAYKKLVKKYHPDRYQDEGMKEVATEKMTEINNAYDTIMDQRKNGGGYSAGSTASASSASRGYGNRNQNTGYAQGGYSYNSSTNRTTYFDSARIRMYINSGNISQADMELNSVTQVYRNAEWHYLKGVVSYQRGWINDAYGYVLTATQMDPINPEYQQMLQRMNYQRSGFVNQSAASSPKGVDVCDCMNGLCIADCCCEMLGGDLISCC